MKKLITAQIIFLIFLLYSLSYAGGGETWSTIIGIPEPSFGITEDISMYDDLDDYYDYGSGDVNYRTDASGLPYTHYIEQDNPSCSDADAYGTHSTPRCSLPANFQTLPEGSVVRIKGGTFDGTWGLTGDGTLAKPTFISGIDTDIPIFTATVTYSNIIRPYCDYTIIENIKFDLADRRINAVRFGLNGEAVDSLAFRHCEITNSEDPPTAGNTIFRIMQETGVANLLTNLVFYKNNFHDLSYNNPVAESNDVTALSIDTNVEDVWIVNNTFNKIGADGIQIAWDSYAVANSSVPNHIYIGKNDASDCFENFLDLKMVKDVIISQNTAHDFGEYFVVNADDDARPFRFGHTAFDDGEQRSNIWCIFNLVYNSHGWQSGAYYASWNETGLDPVSTYFIGNLAYNIHDNIDQTSSAFYSDNHREVSWINNSAYNVDTAAVFIGDTNDHDNTEVTTVSNNIFSTIHPSSSLTRMMTVWGQQDSINRMEIKNNVYYDDVEVNILERLNDDITPYTAVVTSRTYSNFCIQYDGDPNTDQCIGSMEDDPEFVNPSSDLHLQSTSPARDAGDNTIRQAAEAAFFSRYGISIAVDYDGVGSPINSTYDIGAYEYFTPGQESIIGIDMQGCSID